MATDLLTLLVAIFGLTVYIAFGVETLLSRCPNSHMLDPETPAWKTGVTLMLWPIFAVVSIVRSGVFEPESDPE